MGWQKAIDSNFISGIHSQATGSGKSLIALKEINEYNKKCISSYKLGEYLDFLYKKEISEFCLDDKKYYE